MTITATATATPIQELINIFPSIAGALSRVDNVELDINNNIKPQTNKIPDIDNKVSASVNRLDDIEYSKLSDLFQKYGTLDDKLIEQIDRVNSIDDVIETDIKPKNAKILNFLGNALDALDVVSFVTDLIINSALAAAIATVGANSVARDDELRTLLNNLGIEVDGIRSMNESQFNTLMDSINGVSSKVDVIENQNNSISYKVDEIGIDIDSANNLINLTRNEVGNVNNTINLIKDDVADIESQTSGDSIRNRAKEGACLALQECSNQGDLLSLLSDIKSAIGNGDIFCGTSFIATNLTDGIAAIYCRGDNNSGNNNPDIDIKFDEQNLKLDELVTKLEELKAQIRIWLYNSLLDNRINFREIDRVIELNYRALSEYINECKKQQLIRFDSIDIIPLENDNDLLDLNDVGAALDRAATQAQQVIATVLANDGIRETALNSIKVAESNELVEQRLNEEAPDTIKGLPSDYLL